MKKIYTLVAALMVAGSFASHAQMDTLLYQSFNWQSFYDDTLQLTVPSDLTNDPLWYSYDEDGIPDGSTQGRDDGWFPSYAYAYVDTTNNSVIASNSWTNLGESGTPTSNWLITGNVQLGATATLSWKSATYQTPLYLDGYEVRISTTTNSDLSFNTVLFRAAEFTGNPGPNDSVFAGYTFAPTSGTPTPWVHGLDQTYIEYHNDSARWRGVLAPHSVSLDAYANMNVFIAIRHYTHDDNLLSMDDVLITGAPVGIKENNMAIGLNVYPNPATDLVNVNYDLPSSTNVTINVYDIAGKLVMSRVKDVQSVGYHTESINAEELNSGFYTVSVVTELGRSTTKLIVK